MIQSLNYLKKNKIKALFLLTFLAIILRATFVFCSYSKNGVSNWSDDLYYLFLGQQIADGNWQPQSEGRPQMVVGPVIPLIIASFTKLFSDPLIPFFIYNILVTSALIILLYYLGKELCDLRTGWLLSIWGFLFVDYYKYLPHILKEPTIYFLVPLTLLLLIRSIRYNYSFKYLLTAAISFVILMHTDERFIIYFPVFILFFLLVKPLSSGSFLKPVLTFTGLVFILMLPWGLRNYKVFDQVVILTPRTTVITSKLWGENLEAATSHFTNDEIRRKLNEGRSDAAISFGEEFGIKPYAQGKAEARIKAFINYWQPTYFKPTFIQYGYRPQKWSLAHNLAGLIFYGIFLPFYFIGIFLLFKKNNHTLLFVAAIPVIHSLLHAYMVWPLERYRSPVNFIVALVGIWAMMEILGFIKNKFRISV